jgi:hypothetical protein
MYYIRNYKVLSKKSFPFLILLIKSIQIGLIIGLNEREVGLEKENLMSTFCRHFLFVHLFPLQVVHFETAIGGTFESDTGGTFAPLLSLNVPKCFQWNCKWETL